MIVQFCFNFRLAIYLMRGFDYQIQKHMHFWVKNTRPIGVSLYPLLTHQLIVKLGSCSSLLKSSKFNSQRLNSEKKGAELTL